VKSTGRIALLAMFGFSIVTLLLAPVTGGAASAQPARQNQATGLAGALGIPSGVAPAPGAVLVDNETFRKQLDQYMADVQDLSAMLVSTSYGKEQALKLTPDLVTAAAAARHAVATYTPEQLTILQAAYSHDSAWRDRPAQLKKLFTPKLLAEIKALNADGSPHNVLDETCNPGPGTPDGELDAYIAEDVTFAAQSVMELLPTDLLSIAFRDIATAAYIAAEIAHKVLDQLNGIYVECEGIKAGWRIDQKLPLIDVPLSTLATQVNLNTRATQIDTEIANLRLRLDTRADAIDLGIVNTNIHLDNRANQIDTEIVNTNIHLDNRANQIDTEIATFQALNMRAQIEADLLRNGTAAIALFALPTSVGGYLETARDIVSNTIARTLSSGQSVGQAQVFFAAGQTAYAAHQWKLAYTQYQKAYFEATK
jgi:hypothetical protein